MIWLMLWVTVWTTVLLTKLVSGSRVVEEVEGAMVDDCI